MIKQKHSWLTSLTCCTGQDTVIKDKHSWLTRVDLLHWPVCVCTSSFGTPLSWSTQRGEKLPCCSIIFVLHWPYSYPFRTWLASSGLLVFISHFLRCASTSSGPNDHLQVRNWFYRRFVQWFFRVSREQHVGCLMCSPTYTNTCQRACARAHTHTHTHTQTHSFARPPPPPPPHTHTHTNTRIHRRTHTHTPIPKL